MEEKALFKAGSEYRFRVMRKPYLRLGRSTGFGLRRVPISYLVAESIKRVTRPFVLARWMNKLTEVAVITPIIWSYISDQHGFDARTVAFEILGNRLVASGPEAQSAPLFHSLESI